jgi:hypothetical protein
MPKREVSELIKELRKLGYDIEPTGNNGHWKVRFEGIYMATLPNSPSDKRTMINVRQLLRRIGIPVGKK